MKPCTLLFVVGGLAVSCLISSAPSFAVDGASLFQNKCLSCHRDGGEAKTVAPAKYASVQWEKFFNTNKHKKKKDIDSQFSVDELGAIKKYLSDHAADSDSPEVTGMRIK